MDSTLNLSTATYHNTKFTDQIFMHGSKYQIFPLLKRNQIFYLARGNLGKLKNVAGNHQIQYSCMSCLKIFAQNNNRSTIYVAVVVISQHIQKKEWQESGRKIGWHDEMSSVICRSWGNCKQLIRMIYEIICKRQE